MYATLPTKERLSRERTKSDRKQEEDNFHKKPKETNNDVQQHAHSNAHTAQSSNVSAGSGDGAASLSPYIILRSTNEWPSADENNNVNVQVPTFYGGRFRIWQRDSEYDLPTHGQTIHRRQTYVENESNDELDGEEQFNQPQPPMVLHHTIQHVYHTVEASRNEQNDILEDETARDNNVRNDSCRGSSEWRNAEHDHNDHTSEYTPPPCTCRDNGSFRDFRYHRYPYMNSPGAAQSIPRVYAYPQYACGYPYASSSCYHPPSGMHTHFVPLTYQNPRASYATPINIAANSTNLRFCPVGGYRQHVNLLRNPYAQAAAHNESSSETPHCLHYEDERRHENDSDNENDDVGLTNGNRNSCECEFHRPLQYLRLRREPLPSDFRGRSSRLDFNDTDLTLVSNNSSDNEAHPLREARMEISETRQEHSDHEDHVFTLSFSVPRSERQEADARQSSPLGFSRFGEISRGPRRF